MRLAGRLYNVIVWDRELTDGEVAAAYEACGKPIVQLACDEDVIAYYAGPFARPFGSIWPDLSRYGRDATLSGTRGLAPDGAVTFIAGAASTGMRMGDLVDASGAYTVASWFQYTGSSEQSYSAIFGSTSTSGSTNWFHGKNTADERLGVQVQPAPPRPVPPQRIPTPPHAARIIPQALPSRRMASTTLTSPTDRVLSARLAA